MQQQCMMGEQSKIRNLSSNLNLTSTVSEDAPGYRRSKEQMLQHM